MCASIPRVTAVLAAGHSGPASHTFRGITRCHEGGQALGVLGSAMALAGLVVMATFLQSLSRVPKFLSRAPKLTKLTGEQVATPEVHTENRWSAPTQPIGVWGSGCFLEEGQCASSCTLQCCAFGAVSATLTCPTGFTPGPQQLLGDPFQGIRKPMSPVTAQVSPCSSLPPLSLMGWGSELQQCLEVGEAQQEESRKLLNRSNT